MKEENAAVIQFKGYRVTEMSFLCSADYEFPEGEISYSFHFSKTFLPLSDTEIQENIGINLFYPGSETTMENAPYRLNVEIAGRFSSTSPWQPEWEQNAMAILFPYLRSLVSLITSNSGREPVILPTINISSLFEP